MFELSRRQSSALGAEPRGTPKGGDNEAEEGKDDKDYPEWGEPGRRRERLRLTRSPLGRTSSTWRVAPQTAKRATTCSGPRPSSCFARSLLASESRRVHGDETLHGGR